MRYCQKTINMLRADGSPKQEPLLKLCALLCIAFCLLVFPALSVAQTNAASGLPLPEARAHRLPSLFEGDQQLNLDAPMGVLTVSAGSQIGPEQLLQSPLAGKFVAWQPGMALPTSELQDAWLRLQLPIQSRPQSWFLRIPRLALDKVTLFQAAPGNPAVWTQQSAGTDVPHSSWPVRSRDPIFEISTRSDQTQTLFVRLQHGKAITEGVQLIHSADFGNGANHAGTLSGLTIGIFLVLTLISLISWRINRSSQLGWFALLCLAMLVTQLTVSGYMLMRVWPNSVYLAKTAGWVVPLMGLAALARFALSVSYARDLSRPIYFALCSLVAVCALASLGILATPHDFPREALNALYAAGMLLIIGSLAWIASRSLSWLWFIVASLVPLILSGLTRLAYNLGWVANMELALLAGVISAALGLICIYATLVTQQRQRIVTVQREDALETTDISTGLFNERIVRARLPQIIVRSKRASSGNGCGAILVRWLDFEQVMATASTIERGRIFAHLGNRLSRLAREIDTVGRFAEDQFIFLVEAPVSHEQLSALASKILTTCMRPSPALPEQKGFDMHLAVWLSSELPSDAPSALELLKTRINQMREGTQRRVQFINTPLSTAPTLDQSDPEHAKKLVEKINELEKTHGLPTIEIKSRKVDQNSANAGS